MGILDDDREIDLQASIKASQDYVKNLYQEADAKRREVINYLWDLESQKYKGDIQKEFFESSPGWNAFKEYEYEVEVEKNRQDLFGIPEPYETLKSARDSLKMYKTELEDKCNSFMFRSVKQHALISRLYDELLNIYKQNKGMETNTELLKETGDELDRRDWQSLF